ncbi:MAG: helix-turn-helix domain-containing protein [Treponemataceae bacterium]
MNSFKRVDKKRKNRAMAILASKGMTITSLSYRIGVSRPYISDVINGKKPYRSAEEKIAKAVRVPVEYLFPKKSLSEIKKAANNL